jgi:peptidyl-prolyl cis-trans isomerase C
MPDGGRLMADRAPSAGRPPVLVNMGQFGHVPALLEGHVMRTIRLLGAAALLAAFACAARAQTTTTPATTTPATTTPATSAPAAGAPVAEAPATNAPAADAAAAAVPAAKPDPVVARVNGSEIHLSDVQEAVAGLPEEYRNLPPQMLFPMLIDQMVDRKAVVLLARKDGLDKDPAVQKQIARAEDSALQNALLGRDVGPQVTDAKVKARYDATIAGKPGEEEVHARHILVAKEEDAKDIIDQLNKGADFATLAKAHSTDPGAAQGGDLGFFKKADMLPEFSAAAFALQPGQITETPVRTQYGWHVIKLEEKRQAPPPSYEQSHDQLRQEMIQEGVKKVVAEARQGLTIEKFNPDGSAPKVTDAAEPPPPAAPAQ